MVEKFKYMSYLLCFSLFIAIGILFIALTKDTGKKIVALLSASVLASICVAIPAVNALSGHAQQWFIDYLFPFGAIYFRLDALSAWFILITQFVLLMGIVYGLFYMRPYQKQNAHLSVHIISWMLLQWSLSLACIVQHSIAFLIFWELITLSAFMLIIWEHGKKDTIKAGLNYLIQSHISVAILTVVFLVLHAKTGSWDFNAFKLFSKLEPSTALVLYILMFAGFALKAGFIPFHTWLPKAHPAAPSHVSGVMSGVIIKMGLYGLLRFTLLYSGVLLIPAWTLVFVGVFTALYGVMHSTVQRNFKAALAYSSIENIGIAGLGIGIGMLGMNFGKPFMIYAGFGAALVHVLVHATLKPALFFCAGTVYQLTHKLDMEQLGGLSSKMPKTAFLFSIAGMAISGLPPFGAFISEFLIISGIVYGISTLGFAASLSLIIVLILFAVTSGAAVLSFTRTAGIVFSGNTRSNLPDHFDENHRTAYIPVIVLISIALLVGCFPSVIFNVLLYPLELFQSTIKENPVLDFNRISEMLSQVGIVTVLLTLIVVGGYYFRKKKLSKRVVTEQPTWGCGYTAPTPRIQYTGYAYSRSVTILFSVFFNKKKDENVSRQMFVPQAELHVENKDIVEQSVIDTPVKTLTFILGMFGFLQNGRLQYYIMYGLIFMLAIFVLTFFGIIA